MKEEIIQVITQTLGVEPGVITERTTIYEVEEWDSLGQLMILSELKDRLGLDIPIEVAIEIKSVGDFISFAESRG